MKTLETLLPYVTPSVLGCPDPVAIQALRQACVDLCGRADLVQRIYTIDCVAGTGKYVIPVPDDMNLSRVIRIGWKDRTLTPVATDGVYTMTALRGQSIGPDILASGDPVVYFQDTPTSNEFILSPVPDTGIAAGLTVRAAYTPAQSALTVDDYLIDNYADEIASGALARLLAMPGQQFSSPGAAAMHRANFESGVSAARRQKEMGQTAGSQRISPRRFA